MFGMSQKDFGDAIGVTQGNVSHYELGHQDMPPSVARRLIEAARERDLMVTWDDIYGSRQPTPSAAPKAHAA